ncbi:MAG: hypothetical protein CSA11_00050 [Chloroflexi bacterium]|nr:MAG: hypothetical protein CSA11_00050 [Chloroflexota bacterium]
MGTFHIVRSGRILEEINATTQDLWAASIPYLNSLGWLLSWVKEGNVWYLYSSNRLIYTCNEWPVLQSFVYGLVHSTLRIKSRLEYGPTLLNYKQIVEDLETPKGDYSILSVFDELIYLNERILEFEMRLTRVARAASMYKVFQNKEFDPRFTRDYEQFAVVYERKLALEKALKSLSRKNVDDLKSAARNLRLIEIRQPERFPTALAFLTLHLEKKNYHWYRNKGRWLYFEGDREIYFSDDKDDFEGFILGMAYNYAKLPEETLERYIKGLRIS